MSLTHPTTPGFKEIEWLSESKVVLSESAFTFSQQVYAWPGKRRKVTATLPPMAVDLAKKWMGFFHSCNGPENTFFFYPTIDKTSSGNYSNETVTVDSINSARGEITVSGFTASVSDILLAGDWLSIRDRLYTVKEDLSSDGSGNGVIKVWPQAENAVVASDSVEIQNPRGVFRLTAMPSNIWTVNSLSRGITFNAVESIV